MALIVAGAPALATAQDDPPYDPSIDVQLFEYSTGPNDFLTVTGTDVAPKGSFTVNGLITFLTKPFTIYDVDESDDSIEGERTTVIESLLAGEVGGAYGITDTMHLGVALPIIFALSGEGLDPPTGSPAMDELSAAGLGDMRVELKVRVWETQASGGSMMLAVAPGVSLPTSFGSHDSDFLGDDLPTLRGRASLHWRDGAGNFDAAANAGLIFRKPRTIYSSEVGQQLTYGAAGAFHVTSRVDLIAELFGRTGLTSFDLDASPLEANGAVKVAATRAVAVLVGGGAGVIKGLGSPGLRVFASVGWAPDYRDTDGDGVKNNKDGCVLVPEDRDSFQDLDGCPDEDNDSDKRLDPEDKCVNEPEDLDGFDDDDGCPEDDNDQDTFKDADDRCPNDKEDGRTPFEKDGCPANKRDSDDDGTMDDADKCPEEQEDQDNFEDFDGCPDPDNDADFIPDEFDKCPLCPEDTDGFGDDDGCPEEDNDSDGLLDGRDKCAAEAEVINGINDFDGCPDEGGSSQVSLDGDQMSIGENVAYTPTGTISRRSFGLVDQVAAHMLLHKEVTQWRIVVAAPKQRTEAKTRELSDRAAAALKSYLAKRGVTADIEAVGAVSDTPTTAVVVRERTAPPADDKPVCKEVQPRQPDGSGPAQAADSDDDGIPDDTDKCKDQAETNNGFEDGDGCPDEIPTELKRFTGVIKGINFKTGSDLILRNSFNTLDKAAEVMIEFTGVRVEISGHTDDRGSADLNRDLSQRRADSVRAYLVDHGVDESRLRSIGYGPDKPLCGSKSSACRAKNRRVEFRLLLESEK